MTEKTKELLKLDLKKRLIMRGYQEIVVTDIIDKFGLNTPYVLGSCPGSGKTEMAIEAMIRLIESGEVNRVLVLAHSTNVLKENFYERLCEYFNEGTDIDVMRGQKNYNYNARIQVMIPQNISHVIGKFDLIITDEAQHNVLAEDGNYSHIVEMVEPKFQLLLTGTPSKFVLQNNLASNDGGDLPYHINTVGMDMVGFEHFHNVRFDLIKSAYGFTNEDYNQSKDLYTDVNFSFEETHRTVNNVIIGVVRNIALRNGIILPKDSDFVLEGRKLVQEGKFGKTLIMCRNIEQANQISSIISKLFEVKVRVSQSKNDTDSSNLDKFKRNQFEFLCVVNRAREGYDDNKVVNLIDITMTHNIDLIYQMFCRVVRLDKTNPNPKLHVKVTSNAEGMPDYTMNIMTAALMLGATENLSAFNGRNFRGLVMPRVERDDDGEDDDVIVDGVVDIIDGAGNVVRRRQINDLMALDLIQMFTEDEENLISGNDRYAMTTLGESLKLLTGELDFYSNKEGYFKLIRDENITSSQSWGSKYKELSERDNIKYHSSPYMLFDLTSKEFFNECYPYRKEFFADKEGYFKLFRKENVTSKNWSKKKQYKELSERDGVKYHSQPWNLFDLSVKDFFDECYPENIYINFSKDEYLNFMREENIINSSKWINKYKELSERDSTRYYANPWILFNLGAKEFFNECYPEAKVYSDKEGYFNLIIKEGITGNGGWTNKYKELSERDNIKYHSTPWTLFKLTIKDFFDECYPKRGFIILDKEGYFKLFRENSINNNSTWQNKYIELSERDDVKYNSQPWVMLGLTNKQFFDECYPNRVYVDLDKEGYFKIIRQENITGNGGWTNKYKEFAKRDSVKYHSKPWDLFKLTVKDFFDECYPNKQDFYSDKDGYIQLIRKENITHTTWSKKKQYKELSERDGVKYHSQPWNLFGLTSKQFFDECLPIEHRFFVNKEGYFKIFKENDVTSTHTWKYKFKELSERDNVKYHSNPNTLFNQTGTEFFNEYKEWLGNKSNKYRPAYLGEFSEMNKTWNTTNSKTNHKRLNKDKTEWFKYHELYSNSRKKWDEIPYIELSKKIKDRPDWIVGDFGCGENLLSKEIKNKIHSFDHVAIDDSVKSCDLTDVPLHNNVLDVVVFSLSLMGTNYKEYFDEAYRVLRPMGVVFIAEPATRWEDREEELKGMLEASGFKVTGEVKHSDRFIYVDAIKY